MSVCAYTRETASAVFLLGVQAIGAQLWGLAAASRPQSGDSRGSFMGKACRVRTVFLFMPRNLREYRATNQPWDEICPV